MAEVTPLRNHRQDRVAGHTGPSRKPRILQQWAEAGDLIIDPPVDLDELPEYRIIGFAVAHNGFLRMPTMPGWARGTVVCINDGTERRPAEVVAVYARYSWLEVHEV